LLDSFYFTVVTLATVGYGDLSPTTPASKIFTVIYIFLGVSIFVTFVGMLARDRQSIFNKRSGLKSDDTGNSDDGNP